MVLPSGVAYFSVTTTPSVGGVIEPETVIFSPLWMVDLDNMQLVSLDFFVIVTVIVSLSAPW